MDTIKSTITSSTDSFCCSNCWVRHFSEFKNCSVEVQKNLLLKKEEKKYTKGAYLIKNGDLVAGVFCIQKGNVKVFKKGMRNKEFIMWVAGKGDMIGLNSFINDETYSFSAAALNETACCFLPAYELKTLLNMEPIAFVRLMRNLCQKINFVERRITSISKKSVREQCAELLISIVTQNSFDNDKKLTINYSVKDLASFVGTTKNYLYKVLEDFNNKEILSVRNRKMFIHNINALSSIASGHEK